MPASHRTTNILAYIALERRSGWLFIRALSPAFAVKFNISPGRWQHFPLWLLFVQRDKGKQTGHQQTSERAAPPVSVEEKGKATGDKRKMLLFLLMSIQYKN
jgi:hypothetical protein